MSQQRIERDRQTLKYNKSDLSKQIHSRTNSNRLYQSSSRDVHTLTQNAYYIHERQASYHSQPVIE
jgi:hypothetical protein